MNNRNIFVLAETASTNNYIKENRSKFSHGDVCYTTRQSAGKGRLGRTWDTGENDALAMSIFLDYPKPEAIIQLLPLITALAVSDAVDLLTGEKTELKWPNDVMINDKKTCGILCESVFNAENVSVIVGIGVNLLQSESDFVKSGMLNATSLYAASGKNIHPLITLQQILKFFDYYYYEAKKTSLESVTEKYIKRCSTIGKDVEILDMDGKTILCGSAKSVAADGGLIVRKNGTEHRVYAGEVTIKKQSR